jgi:hypothetical protein
MVNIMCDGHDPNILYAYTLSGALSSASVLQERLPDLEIVISQTVIPNEFGHLDKALMVFPVFPDNDLPF